MATALINGRVLLPEGIRDDCCVVMEGQRIGAVSATPPADSRLIDLGGRTVRAKGQPFVVLDEGREVLVRVPSERCYILAQSAAVAR